MTRRRGWQREIVTVTAQARLADGDMVGCKATEGWVWYIVKDLLGQGTFGQVVKCWSIETNSFVAVKVIKNQPAYYHQARVEISILTKLNQEFDPEDKHHIVRIQDHFVFHGHLCIAFEMLGVNLYELIRVNQFRGISLSLLKRFAKQILDSLLVLRNARVIHCDLKPENILLTTSLQSAEIKLIDFGSACMENWTIYSYIQSRFYRSPEVLLGHPPSEVVEEGRIVLEVAQLNPASRLHPVLCLQYATLGRRSLYLRSSRIDIFVEEDFNCLWKGQNTRVGALESMML
eukprot:Gb_18179 [translate_table: standard]